MNSPFILISGLSFLSAALTAQVPQIVDPWLRPEAIVDSTETLPVNWADTSLNPLGRWQLLAVDPVAETPLPDELTETTYENSFPAWLTTALPWPGNTDLSATGERRAYVQFLGNSFKAQYAKPNLPFAYFGSHGGSVADSMHTGRPYTFCFVPGSHVAGSDGVANEICVKVVRRTPRYSESGEVVPGMASGTSLRLLTNASQVGGDYFIDATQYSDAHLIDIPTHFAGPDWKQVGENRWEKTFITKIKVLRARETGTLPKETWEEIPLLETTIHVQTTNDAGVGWTDVDQNSDIKGQKVSRVFLTHKNLGYEHDYGFVIGYKGNVVPGVPWVRSSVGSTTPSYGWAYAMDFTSEPDGWYVRWPQEPVTGRIATRWHEDHEFQPTQIVHNDILHMPEPLSNWSVVSLDQQKGLGLGHLSSGIAGDVSPDVPEWLNAATASSNQLLAYVKPIVEGTRRKWQVTYHKSRYPLAHFGRSNAETDSLFVDKPYRFALVAGSQMVANDLVADDLKISVFDANGNSVTASANTIDLPSPSAFSNGVIQEVGVNSMSKTALSDTVTITVENYDHLPGLSVGSWVKVTVASADAANFNSGEYKVLSVAGNSFTYRDGKTSSVQVGNSGVGSVRLSSPPGWSVFGDQGYQMTRMTTVSGVPVIETTVQFLTRPVNWQQFGVSNTSVDSHQTSTYPTLITHRCLPAGQGYRYILGAKGMIGLKRLSEDDNSDEYRSGLRLPWCGKTTSNQVYLEEHALAYSLQFEDEVNWANRLVNGYNFIAGLPNNQVYTGKSWSELLRKDIFAEAQDSPYPLSKDEQKVTWSSPKTDGKGYLRRSIDNIPGDGWVSIPVFDPTSEVAAVFDSGFAINLVFKGDVDYKSDYTKKDADWEKNVAPLEKEYERLKKISDERYADYTALKTSANWDRYDTAWERTSKASDKYLSAWDKHDKEFPYEGLPDVFSGWRNLKANIYINGILVKTVSWKIGDQLRIAVKDSKINLLMKGHQVWSFASASLTGSWHIESMIHHQEPLYSEASAYNWAKLIENVPAPKLGLDQARMFGVSAPKPILGNLNGQMMSALDSDNDGVEDQLELLDLTDPGNGLSLASDVRWVKQRSTSELVDSMGHPLGDGSLQKNSGVATGWNTDASSRWAMLGDGALSFRSALNGKDMFVGLAEKKDSVSYPEVKYAVRFSPTSTTTNTSTTYTVLPATGTWEAGAIKTYDSSTRFALKRVGSDIQFYRDGALVYTVSNASSAPMVATAVMYTSGGMLAEARMWSANDADADGMADDWERSPSGGKLGAAADLTELRGFKPDDDADQDLATNAEEHALGTLPWSKYSGPAKETALPLVGPTRVIKDGSVWFKFSPPETITAGQKWSVGLNVHDQDSTVADLDYAIRLTAIGASEIKAEAMYRGIVKADLGTVSTTLATHWGLVRRQGKITAYTRSEGDEGGNPSVPLFVFAEGEIEPMLLDTAYEGGATDAVLNQSLSCVTGDQDEDGMADDWELAALDLPLDAMSDDEVTSALSEFRHYADQDADLSTNRQEFWDNTDPNDPASNLQPIRWVRKRSTADETTDQTEINGETGFEQGGGFHVAVGGLVKAANNSQVTATVGDGNAFYIGQFIAVTVHDVDLAKLSSGVFAVTATTSTTVTYNDGKVYSETAPASTTQQARLEPVASSSLSVSAGNASKQQNSSNVVMTLPSGHGFMKGQIARVQASSEDVELGFASGYFEVTAAGATTIEYDDGVENLAQNVANSQVLKIQVDQNTLVARNPSTSANLSADAQSSLAIRSGGTLAFRFGQVDRTAAIGLTRSNDSLSRLDLDFGFMSVAAAEGADSGTYKLIIAGAEVADTGPFDRATMFQINVSGPVVRFLVDG